MSYGFLDIATTPSVRRAQAAMGSEGLWADFKGHRAFDRFTPDARFFIEGRDSFYLATVSESGWPYVQHRGGAPGFLKMVDERTLAFADYRGNRQYLSLGNLAADDRACLILVDYPRRARLKIFARVEVVPLGADPELESRVAVAGYNGKPERILKLRLAAFDWNCQQHITPRFTESEIDEAVAPLRDRLDAMASENAALRAALEAARHVGPGGGAFKATASPAASIRAAATPATQAHQPDASKSVPRTAVPASPPEK